MDFIRLIFEAIWARPRWSTLAVLATVFFAIAYAAAHGYIPVSSAALLGKDGAPGLVASFTVILIVAAAIVIGKTFSAWQLRRQADALIRYQEEEIKRRGLTPHP